MRNKFLINFLQAFVFISCIAAYLGIFLWLAIRGVNILGQPDIKFCVLAATWLIIGMSLYYARANLPNR